MTISTHRPAAAVIPDFTSENGETAQGVPTIVAGQTRALTLGFTPTEVGKEGARVRVQSLLVANAMKAVKRARLAEQVHLDSGDAAALIRARAARERRELEYKKALVVTLDAYGVALDEDNKPYVVEERYPAILGSAQHSAIRPVIDLTRTRGPVVAAA